MLIKVLDGVDVNDHAWVYFAATTNVGYTVTVTDTVSGIVKQYNNPLGVQSPATLDNEAFRLREAAEQIPTLHPIGLSLLLIMILVLARRYV